MEKRDNLSLEPIGTEYEIRDYQPEDESSALALFQLGLGGGITGVRDKAFWRWKHLENPFGSSIGLVATNHDGQLIGLRTFMQWRFTTGGRTVKAVRAVDTVTHPQYRRYGVFTALTKRAIEQAKSSGIDLVFNTPNKNVMPGYLKLGWRYVSTVRPLIKVLNYPRFVAGILRSWKNRQSSGQPAIKELFRNRLISVEEFLGHTEVLESLLNHHNRKRDGKLCTDLSAAYLRWRYSRHPHIDYTILYSENNGVSSGYLVLRPNTRFGLKEVVLNEMLLPRSEEGLALSLLDELERSVSADYIIAYFPRNSFECYVLRKRDFHQVPTGGMNFAVNVLAEGLPCNPTVLGNWDISLGDLEIF